MRLLLLLLFIQSVLGFSSHVVAADPCQAPQVTLPGPKGYCGPKAIAFTLTNPDHKPTYVANTDLITSYEWTVNGIVMAKDPYPTINFPNKGSYEVKIKVTNSCGEAASAIQTISIEEYPQPPVVENIAVCTGSLGTLWVSNPDPALIYKWYANATSTTPLVWGTSYTTSVSGDYYIEAVTHAGCVSATRTKATLTTSATNGNALTIGTDQTICAGATPAGIGGNAPQNMTFQWFQSTKAANTDFYPIVSATDRNYTPPALNQTTWYKRIAYRDGCGEESNTVKITVTPKPATPVVEDVIICSGTQATLTVQNADPNMVYRWYNVATTALAGSGPTFTTPVLTANTLYYVEASTTAITNCPNTSRTEVQVFVTPAISNNTITSDQELCTGGTPASLVGSTPSGGGGGYSYQWQHSTDGTLFTDIEGARGQHYAPPSLTVTTWYRRRAQSACPQVTSNIIRIAVSPLAASIDIVDPAACYGSGTSITIANPNPDYTYSWYDVATGGTALQTGTSFSTGPLTAKRTYYVEARSSAGCVSLRRKVEVTVTPQPVTPAADAVTVCFGGSAMLTVKQPDDNLLYRWYASDKTLVGTGNVYQTDPLESNTAYYVEAVTKAAPGCISPQKAVEVTITPAISNNIISADQTICSGSTPAPLTGSLPAGGGGSYTYQWESSQDGTSFTAIARATARNYAPPVTAITTWYRRIVTTPGTCPPDISNMIQITVTPLPNVPAASNKVICAGERAILAIDSPKDELTYRWYYSPTSSIVLATGITYTTNILQESTTLYVEAVTAGGCKSIIRKNVIVRVVPAIKNNTVTSNQAICSQATPSKLSGSSPTGGEGPYTYEWEVSTDGTDFTGIPDSNTPDYAPPALSVTTWYRRTVRSGGPCPENTSNPVKITVMPLPETPLAEDATVCTGSSTTLAVKNAGTGVTYRWFDRANGGNLLGTGISYTTEKLTVSTTYYLEAANPSGCTNTPRQTVTILVSPSIANNVVEADQKVCFGASPARITGSLPGGGNSSYTYQWQQSEDNNTFTDIMGATGQHYTPGSPFTKTTWYRRKVASPGPCPESYSFAVKIEAVPLPLIPKANSVTICPGERATLQVAASTMPDEKMEWYSAPTGGSVLHIGNTFVSPAHLSTVSYYVQSVNETGCASPGRQEVKVNVIPAKADAGNDVTIMEGKQAQLRAEGGVSYTWSPAESLSDPTLSNPVASPRTTTTYTVTITTDAGCTDTDQVTVTVMPTVEPANFITPNGDGFNDHFEIKNIDKYPDCRVQIFTRWGELVFESKGYNEPWTGIKNGQVLPTSAYYYIIQLNGNEAPLSGSITIIK